jgi:hypothetical protein
MSKLIFQAKILLNSATPTASVSDWGVNFTFIDREGVFLALDVAVGDVVVLDTGAWELGTLTRYVVTAINPATTFTTFVGTVTYDVTNDNADPALDLNNCAVGLEGVIGRPSPNYKLLPVISTDVQQLSDRFSEYIQNYNFNNLVDTITGGGTGGTAVKPDWNALSTDPAGILNKPTLGTAAALDVPASGNATSTQVVIGSDTRLGVVTPNQTLTNTSPTPTTIGGIAAGTTFSAMPLETVLQNLLYPYQVPAFSAFSLSGQTTPLEVGAAVTGGARIFNWTTTNSTNISTNSITLSDITGVATLASTLANDSTETITLTPIIKTTALTHTWRVSAISTVATTFTRDYSVSWQWRRLYGESTNTSLIATEIQALRVSGLSTTFSGTYVFSAGGYKYIAYPSLFGTATTFKDQSTNLDVPFQPIQIISITNSNGITTNYNVHRTTNVIGSAMNIVVA